MHLTTKVSFSEMNMWEVYKLRKQGLSLGDIIKQLKLTVDAPELSSKLHRHIKAHSLEPCRQTRYTPTAEECQIAIKRDLCISDAAELFNTTYYQLTLCEKAYNLKFRRQENQHNLGPRSEREVEIDPNDIPVSKKVNVEIANLLKSLWRGKRLPNVFGNYYNFT